MNPNPTANPKPPPPTRSTRTLRLRVAGAAVGPILLLGGCGAAEMAQQQFEQAVDAVGESADLAQSVQATADQVGFLAGLLG